MSKDFITVDTHPIGQVIINLSQVTQITPQVRGTTIAFANGTSLDSPMTLDDWADRFNGNPMPMVF